MVRWLAAIFLVALASGAIAQDGKLPVRVVGTGEDRVGRNLVFELKDALRGSNTFRLSDGEPNRPELVVRVVSIDIDDDGRSSAIAYVTLVDSPDVPVNGLYVTSSVLVLGSSKVRDQARDRIASLDQTVEYLRQKWPAVYKMLRNAP